VRTNLKNTGKPFETEITKTCAEYQSQGRLRMKKADPPVRVIGGGPYKRIIQLANPFLDLVGCWTERDGRAVFIECKSTQEPKLSLFGNITENQYEAMHHWHHAGAVVFVLWQWNEEVVLLTAGTVQRHVTLMQAGAGPHHIKFEAGTHVPRGMGFVIYDFLELMHAFWPAHDSEGI